MPIIKVSALNKEEKDNIQEYLFNAVLVGNVNLIKDLGMIYDELGLLSTIENNLNIFMLAARSSNLETYNILKSLGFVYKSHPHFPPLSHIASSSGNLVFLKYILEEKIEDVNIEYQNKTAIAVAMENDNQNCVDYLKQKGAVCKIDGKYRDIQQFITIQKAYGIYSLKVGFEQC
jgi:hypothetical protein